MLSVVEQKEKSFGVDPTLGFKFKMEQKKQCLKCNRVGYRNENTSMLSLIVPSIKSGKILDSGKPEYLPVSFDNILDRYFAEDQRDFQCPFDNEKTIAGL